MQIFANLHLDILASNYSMNSKAFAKIFKCQTSMKMYIEKLEAILKNLHEKEISAESNKWILPNVCSNASVVRAMFPQPLTSRNSSKQEAWLRNPLCLFFCHFLTQTVRLKRNNLFWRWTATFLQFLVLICNIHWTKSSWKTFDFHLQHLTAKICCSKFPNGYQFSKSCFKVPSESYETSNLASKSF